MGEKFEWVEIIEPTRHEHMFANLKTGQCLWDPPPGVAVKPTHANQWWELYDTNTKRYYYYNAASQETVWYKPKDGDIIPLSKLQMLKNKETASTLSCLSLSSSSSATPRKVSQNSIGEQQQQQQQRQEHDSDEQMVRIKDTEIISSSNNVARRQLGARTLSVDNSIDPPMIKEKPKFSSLRVKAPPKPPRINVFDRSGDSSFNASVERSFDRTTASVEKSFEHNTSAVRDETCDDKQYESTSSQRTNSIHCSSAAVSSANTIMTITTHNNSKGGNCGGGGGGSEYASPTDTGMVPCRDSFSSFSPKEETPITLPRTCIPQTVTCPTVVNITKSTPVAPSVEYACPLKILPNTTGPSVARSSSFSEHSRHEYDIPLSEDVTGVSPESEDIVSTSIDMEVEHNVSVSSAISQLNNKVADAGSSLSTNKPINIRRSVKKPDNSYMLHSSEPIVTPPTPVDDAATYENISNVMFPTCGEEPNSDEVSQRSSDFPTTTQSVTTSVAAPTHSIPIAPPPPKILPRRMMPSMYDNVSPGAAGGSFDRSYSDFDDVDSPDTSKSPHGYHLNSGSFEEPALSFEGSNGMDTRSATLPLPRMSPRKLPLAPNASDACDGTPPTKRTPTLVRMKSDPIVDVEKRPKLSKTIGSSIQSTFRPISMLNLSNSIASSKPPKQCGSEGDNMTPNVHLSTHRTGFLRRRMSIHR